MSMVKNEVAGPPSVTLPDGSSSAPKGAQPPLTALPWESGDASITPTKKAWTRHSGKGAAVGLFAGFFAGGIPAAFMSVPGGSAKGGTIATVFLLPFIGLGVAGFMLGRSHFASSKEVRNDKFDADRARAVSVQALEGRALLHDSSALRYYEPQNHMAYPLAEYVVDKVVTTSKDRLTAARALYDRDAVAGLAGHDDRARALVDVGVAGGDPHIWAVVDLHHDAAAAAKAPYTHPNQGAFAWPNPEVDAVLGHFSSDSDSDVVEQGERWHVTQHHDDDVAVINGQLAEVHSAAGAHDVMIPGKTTELIRIDRGRA